MFDIGSKENPRAMLGGGRYDDLLSLFGQEKLPAFGFACGDIIMEDYLRTYNLLPSMNTKTQVFFAVMDEKLRKYVMKIATQLREMGINTEVQLTESKLGNQLKYASKKYIPWVIIIGEEEKAAKQMQLKNMTSGEQSLVSLEEVINTLKS